ncbi:MAG: hypothetical protein AAFO69_21040, partial [Bacteroidota bacterium]
EQLMQEQEWSSGRLQKVGPYYHVNGEMLPNGNYENGAGELLTYHLDGTTIKSRKTYENGLANGPYESTYSNGSPKERGQYVNGLPSGKWTSYHTSGKIASLGEYAKGQKTGRWRFYSKRGKLISVRNFE